MSRGLETGVLLPLTLGPAVPGAHDSSGFILAAPRTCLSPSPKGKEPPLPGTPRADSWRVSMSTTTTTAKHRDSARLRQDQAGSRRPGLWPRAGHTRPLSCTLLPKGRGCQAAVPWLLLPASPSAVAGTHRRAGCCWVVPRPCLGDIWGQWQHGCLDPMPTLPQLVPVQSGWLPLGHGYPGREGMGAGAEGACSWGGWNRG